MLPDMMPVTSLGLGRALFVNVNANGGVALRAQARGAFTFTTLWL